MYNNHGAQRYRETDISSISKEKIIVMLYEKMQSDLMCAQKAIKEGNRIEMTKKINHSQRIVSELRGALDHTIGGEVAQNLESLYDYLFHQHLEVLVNQDESHVVNCLRVLEPLLQAWKQIPSGTGDNTAREQAESQLTTETGSENATQKMKPQDPAPEVPEGTTSLLSVSA
ncbi:MAG: flagellar export chaperone FliS [bacterium]|nr:flagellar export chaperone FliS [bacterium]